MKVDDDLVDMPEGRAVAEVMRLRRALRRHMASKTRGWPSDSKLYEVLPEGPPAHSPLPIGFKALPPAVPDNIPKLPDNTYVIESSAEMPDLDFQFANRHVFVVSERKLYLGAVGPLGLSWQLKKTFPGASR